MDLLPIPSFGEDNIVAMRCGIRPHRQGRVRVEREDAFGKVVVHNYGHGGAGVTLCWGTAEAAVALGAGAVVGEAAVVGGGVVGLTAAYELARAGWRVRVYASTHAHATTSALAGALWLPTGVAWGESDAERREFLGWLLAAKRRFLAQMEEGGWGVRLLPVWEPGHIQQDARFFRDGIVTDWRTIERLPLHGPVREGQAWTALFIDTPVFLDRLLSELGRVGVGLVERTLDRAEQVADLPGSLVVNCTGLGARRLWADDRMVGVRGHLVHMRAQPIDYIYHANYIYMFPRSSVLVLGGSYEVGVEDARVDESICRGILARHRAAHGLEG